ncbi:MAG: Hsp20/alpha crystallin family protein [Deltaproteobacteria bacterium]
MADISRWAPGRHPGELRRLQDELDGWFNNLWSGYGSPEATTRSVWPRADIYEDPEGLQLKFEVPGLEPKDVKVTLAENTLTIAGERKLDHEDKQENYHRIEHSYGAFERSFTLPANLDTEKVRADYKNGVLHVFLPRSERAKPRSIAVKVEAK